MVDQLACLSQESQEHAALQVRQAHRETDPQKREDQPAAIAEHRFEGQVPHRREFPKGLSPRHG
jgi:hypothetical protein